MTFLLECWFPSVINDSLSLLYDRRCTKIIGENGVEKSITDDDKTHITQTVIEKMAGEALRTICIAYKHFGKDDRDWDNEDSIIGDLTCIAIVGIEDPVRKEVNQLFFVSLPINQVSVELFRYQMPS